MAFPGIFAGIANSTSNSDFRHVRFKNWKNSFISMRSFILKYYKHQFGSWPPKARSKKNPFTESGLNRQVLRTLYSDLCALYDLLVDREQMTTRMFNQATHDEPVDPAHAEIVALRKLLEEYVSLLSCLVLTWKEESTVLTQLLSPPSGQLLATRTASYTI